MVSWPKKSCARANGWSLILCFEDLLYASGPENEWQKCVNLHITDPMLLYLSKMNIYHLVCLVFFYVKSLIFLCKRTCKWVTSMLHKSPRWTPGRNETIQMAPFDWSCWKTFKMKIHLYDITLTSCLGARWDEKMISQKWRQPWKPRWNQPVGQIGRWSLMLFQYFKIRTNIMEMFIIGRKNIVNILAWHNLLGQETPRNQFPDNSKRYHTWKLLLKKKHQQLIKYILLLLASNGTWQWWWVGEKLFVKTDCHRLAPLSTRLSATNRQQHWHSWNHNDDDGDDGDITIMMVMVVTTTLT